MKLNNAKKYITNNRIEIIIVQLLLYNLTPSTMLMLFEEQHHG